MSERFARIWDPLQPTPVERRMDPHIVGAAGSVVVAEYTWRARDANDRCFATSTLARYEIRDGLLARAQMYHFDLDGLIRFLTDAARE